MDNNIRKIISEEIGIQFEIKDISDLLTIEVIKQLQQNKDKISDGYVYELLSSVRATNAQREITNIDSAIVNITYQKTENIKEGGKFSPQKIKPQDNGSYTIYIELNISNPKVEGINENKINSIISHELNHAFVYLKKFNLKPKTPIYNETKNKMLLSFGHIDALKKFLVMFYLNLPEEIQARVQEAGSILPKINSDNYNDTIKELYKYQPINDAKRMVKYDSSDLNVLPKETLKLFVDTFNNYLLSSKDKFNYEDMEFKIISDPNKFFKYWTKFINYGGVKLNKKILNLVAKKFNLSENSAINELDNYLVVDFFTVDNDNFE